MDIQTEHIHLLSAQRVKRFLMVGAVLSLIASLPGMSLACPDEPDPAAVPALERLAEKIRKKQPIRLVFWGDSISEVGRRPLWFGGAAKPRNNWGAVLAERLGEKYPGVTFESFHAGIGGQNTYEGLGRLDALWKLRPDVVFVAFGANDSYWHHLYPEQTQRALDEMLGEIQAREMDAVVVGTAGNAPADSCFVHIEGTVEAQRRTARKRGVPFVDTRAAMMAATEGGRRWEEYHLEPTDCHPNDAGHRVWAETVLAVVETALAGLNDLGGQDCRTRPPANEISGKGAEP